MTHPDRLPLIIRRDPVKKNYTVQIGETDLTFFLAAKQGITIEFDDTFMPAEPTVTLRFVPGATDLDLDADLLGYIRALDEHSESA